MQKIFILFVTFSFSLFTVAQDDMPDHRSKRDLFKRIMEKDIRSDVATFSLAGIDEGIGKLPLRTLPATEKGNDFLSFQGENIKVTITTAPFDGSKHKLNYYDNKYLVRIDNKGFFGDYGKVPKTKISQISVTIDGDTVDIPATAFADLYNPILYVNDGGVLKTNNKVLISADGRKVYIYLLKQESGGSYEATFVIQDKKYLKRVVDFDLLK